LSFSSIKLIPTPTGTHFCTFTAEKLHSLWESVKNLDKLFSDDERWNEELFFKRMLDEKVVLETDGGLMILSDITENLRAAGHFIFWDHKLSPRTELLRECILWAFIQFNLQRLEVLIPEYARALIRFVEEKLKFKFEGRMRHRMMYKGQLCDVLILSLLKEEVV
jgi:hypothetical protein